MVDFIEMLSRFQEPKHLHHTVLVLSVETVIIRQLSHKIHTKKK